MIEHENEIVLDIQPLTFTRGEKTIGIADLLILRITYDACSEKGAFCVYKFASFKERRILENGNDIVPIEGWKDDDTILVENFAKQNLVTILGRITPRDLMIRYKKLELEEQEKSLQ